MLDAYEQAALAAGVWSGSGKWALVLSGPAGTSKSALAAAVVQQCRFGGWLGAKDLSEYARQSQGALSVGAIRRVCSPFVLDDLGSEYATYYSNVMMDGLVAEFYEHRAPLIITTNLSKAKLAEAYSARMVDRLAEETLWLDTGAWPSFRGVAHG